MAKTDECGTAARFVPSTTAGAAPGPLFKLFSIAEKEASGEKKSKEIKAPIDGEKKESDCGSARYVPVSFHDRDFYGKLANTNP